MPSKEKISPAGGKGHMPFDEQLQRIYIMPAMD